MCLLSVVHMMTRLKQTGGRDVTLSFLEYGIWIFSIPKTVHVNSVLLEYWTYPQPEYCGLYVIVWRLFWIRLIFKPKLLNTSPFLHLNETNLCEQHKHRYRINQLSNSNDIYYLKNVFFKNNKIFLVKCFYTIEIQY